MPRLLIIAGSDSSGGAGIQADVKTATAYGVYAMTAITAVTVQDTLGVHGIHPVPPATVSAQIQKALGDIGADAIKIGMLGDEATVNAVADAIKEAAKTIPVVLDPVMVAKGGSLLLEESAIAAIKARLLPLAALVTPNIPEAEKLSGFALNAPKSTALAAQSFFAAGAKAVLFKGGHAAGSDVTDILIPAEGDMKVFIAKRQNTRSTHGTGCTLASAIASGLATGLTLYEAVARAHAYVQKAITAAPGLGAGHGPLNHMHSIAPFKG